jgi:diguanylate cyclase (GGDEF)-like protein
MGLNDSSTELISLSLPFLGTCLYCAVFTFLWNRSGVVYFGLWSLAWLVDAAAVIFRAVYRNTDRPLWGLAYSLMVFAFAIVLLAAAQAGLSGRKADWRTPLKFLLFFPIFLLFAYLLTRGGGRTEGYRALQGIVFAGIFFYNFAVIGGYTGPAGKFFRMLLLCLSLLYMQQAVGFLYFHFAGVTEEWVRYLAYNRLAEFGLGGILTFFGLAMWIEIQNDRISEIARELDRVRRENLANQDLDILTGLLNQSALAKRMEDTSSFDGVVTVCDMDNFKDVNDRYGHLVGDETLRNIGHLLRSSIRGQDEAFRWGGDEFVILFHNQNQEVARNRMRAIESRLHDFNVRGYGALSISFSWGTAEANGRPLRETLDEADQCMYELKRGRKNT